MKRGNRFRIPIAVLFVLFVTTGLAGCSKRATSGGGANRASTPAGFATEAPAPSPDEAAESDVVAEGPSRRPGLGTSFGERHHSQVSAVPFVRRDSRPAVTLAIWYDDIDGVKGMMRFKGSGRPSSRTDTPDGSFGLAVMDEHGRLLDGVQIGDKRFAVGAAGQRYMLGIDNGSSARFEVVASVDGLDVIDGGEASFSKRGYIVDPHSSIVIEGWRTSDESVAAFRFGTVDKSYAERTGRGRNVGVVGAAFFREEGGLSGDELQRRDSADPFPGRFAAPPP